MIVPVILGAFAMLALALASRASASRAIASRATPPPAIPITPAQLPPPLAPTAAEAEALNEWSRVERPAPAPTPSPEPVRIPADVAVAVRDVANRTATEEQVRSAAQAAREAGLHEAGAALAAVAASVTELGDPNRTVPASITQAIDSLQEGRGVASELRAAAVAARAAGFPATMALLQDRATLIESGTLPTGQAAADQMLVLATVSDLRSNTATADQLRAAAPAAERIGMAQAAAIFARAVQTAEALARLPAPPGADPRAWARLSPSQREEVLRVMAAAPQQVATPQQTVAPRAAPRAVSAPDPRVRTMQELLRTLGYDPGGIDGRYGDKTRRALIAFQRVHGIQPADGAANAATLLALRAELQSRPVAAAAGRALARPAPRPTAHKALVSPWPDVSNAKWASFVRALKMANPNAVDDRGRMGMFLYDARKLEKHGILRAVRVEDGRRVGTFRSPAIQAAWLKPETQIAILKRDMVALRREVEAAHAQDIGTEQEERAATLSGLLAVAHAAGTKGLRSWLTNESDRARFPNTTAAYHRATGKF